MSKKERFLIWHYKHHRLCSVVWTALGWASLPVVAVIGKSSGWFTLLLLLWYTIFCISPAAVASALMLVCTEKHGLVESTT